MKVLNEAEVGPWSMEIICKCGAILEVEVDDFKKYGDFEGGHQVGVACARCKARIYVPDAPSVVWETLREEL